MGATETELQAFVELAGATIINVDSPEIQKRIKKKEEVQKYAADTLHKLSKEKISLTLGAGEKDGLIPIGPEKVDERLGFPCPMEIYVVCCLECIDDLEHELSFDRSIFNKTPCGELLVIDGDLCPFCGKLYVGWFEDSITDFLALYGYNRRYTRKNPLGMLKKFSKKEFHGFWKMDQFPDYIFLNGHLRRTIGGVIKSPL